MADLADASHAIMSCFPSSAFLAPATNFSELFMRFWMTMLSLHGSLFLCIRCIVSLSLLAITLQVSLLHDALGCAFAFSPAAGFHLHTATSTSLCFFPVIRDLRSDLAFAYHLLILSSMLSSRCSGSSQIVSLEMGPGGRFPGIFVGLTSSLTIFLLPSPLKSRRTGWWGLKPPSVIRMTPTTAPMSSRSLLTTK